MKPTKLLGSLKLPAPKESDETAVTDTVDAVGDVTVVSDPEPPGDGKKEEYKASPAQGRKRK